MEPAIAKVELPVRRPPADAYRAFVQPEILTKFWLGSASGALAPNRQIVWKFLVAGASATLDVRSMVENRSIETAWDDGTTIVFTFDPFDDESTLVRVTQTGFQGSPEKVVAQALDATQGFTLVLCELKALLEQNVRLNAVPDKARSIEQAKDKRR